MKRNNLVGDKYGRLTVVSYAGKDKNGLTRWHCECECGEWRTVLGCNLRSGHTKSCGCAYAKHGHTSNDRVSPSYRCWASMISRCTIESDHSYGSYGAAGIAVHSEWMGRGGFEAFIAHIGPRPSCRHSIDRIDGAKGYEPGNVRWATPTEQSRNIKSNRWVVVNGEKMIAKDAAARFGINYKTLLHRLRKMDVDAAVSTPVRGKERVEHHVLCG